MTWLGERTFHTGTFIIESGSALPVSSSTIARLILTRLMGK
jgi:hypothetical protein